MERRGELTTQNYFKGDKYNHWDPWWRVSLAIRLERHTDPLAQHLGVVMARERSAGSVAVVWI